jgi:hypothetical protein
MAFEYDWLMTFAKLKVELVYFFDDVIVVTIIGVGRMNSGIRGFLIGPTELVASCVEAIAIHIIHGE